MGRSSKCAFTMVEMLVATSVFALIFGLAAMLYVHATWRTANAMQSNRLQGEVRDLSKFLDTTIQNATTCQIVSGGRPAGYTALQCTMPANGVNQDQYGLYTSYTPANCSGSQVHWGTNMNRWVYFSDTSGHYGNSGTYLWAAEKQNGNPDNAAEDQNFTFYGGNTANYNWPLISNVTFTVNSANNTVTYTITASDMFASGQTLGTSTDTADSRSLTVTRTVYWRHSVT